MGTALTFEKTFEHHDKTLHLKNNQIVLDTSTLVLFFDFDTFLPNGEEVLKLSGLIDCLKKNTSSKLSISGYTDHIGRSDYNLNLSQKRARGIADYLIAQGIESDRLTYQGLGELPSSSNLPEENRANRRVEIRLQKHP